MRMCGCGCMWWMGPRYLGQHDRKMLLAALPKQTRGAVMLRISRVLRLRVPRVGWYAQQSVRRACLHVFLI